MLPMQIIQRGGDFPADIGDFRIGQRKFGQPRQSVFPEMRSITMIGLHRKIARRDEFWNVHAGQPRQDHLLHLETDDCRWVRRLPPIFGTFISIGIVVPARETRQSVAMPP